MNGPARPSLIAPRRRSLVLLGAGLLLIGLHSLYWYLAEERLQTGLRDWLALRRATGWAADAGPVIRGGWPLAASLTVHDLKLAGGEPDIPGGLSFGAEHVVLSVALFQPQELRLQFEGMQHLRLSHWPDIPFVA